ncbi:STAS domain-containing protein [Streptacidiphilus carbonis]|jgi:anti-anti-sigma factor|uniref:STAS domain-containing protein n=1 Tax=Streptacidiphilus carbonis TaxID=105422 RepID=UPI0005A8C5E0|nr:STAS domain-containing protein [Streptacidiphilus carbonis]
MDQGAAGATNEDAGDARFSVSVGPGQDAPDATVLRLAGELDHDTADTLSSAFETVFAAGAPRVLVDCAALEFCDSTGLNVLLRARMTAADSGSAVELTGLHAAVARLFEITGVDGVFRTYPTLADGLGADALSEDTATRADDK